MTEEIAPFNWHAADRDSFVSWAFIAMISDRRNHVDVTQKVLHASDGGTNLKITLEINGVRMSGMPFFERLWQEMQHQAKAHAVEMVAHELSKLRDTTDSVERIMKMAAEDVRHRFKELGLPMEEDEWWS